MFGITDSAGQSVSIEISAWQSFKAGAAFSAGVIVFATTIGAVWGIIVSRFWTGVMLRAIQELTRTM